jgi:hypothetical protein
LIGALERGLLVDAALDVFDSEWLPAMFARERQAIQAEHALLQAQVASPTSVEHSLIGKVAQQMLRRAIQLVRGARHGGLILVVDTGEGAEARPLAGLRLKYSFTRDEPARRYRTLLFQILEAVAETTTKDSVGWADFASSSNARFEELEQAIFEQSRVLANLTAIDGALVLDKRFEVLGFGAEVSAELPTPSRVWRAVDTEGRLRNSEDIENVGTRHRAAYRFVNDHPDGLAVVISQDGGVSFVAKREEQVVFWEQSVSP